MKTSMGNIFSKIMGAGPGYASTVYEYEGGIYFLFIKKHYCEKCSGLLKRWSEETIEKKYYYGGVDSQPLGPTKVVRYFFYCPACETRYNTLELKEAERR